MRLPPHILSTGIRLLCVMALIAAPLITTLLSEDVQAAAITPRKLTLKPGTTDGGSKPDGTVDHEFDITLPTAGNLGSIILQYCTTAGPDTTNPDCTAPSDGGTAGTFIDTTSVGYTNTSGPSGFTASAISTDPANATVKNAVLLTRAPASISASTPTIFTLTDIINPDKENLTFFVWIKTYAIQNATTSDSVTDSGTVAASTANPIVLTGQMPESLTFCTGATVPTKVAAPNDPDCANATSGDINFDILFDPNDTSIAESQMAAGTNASNGYSISVQGETLKQGSDSITPIPFATPSSSTPGASQFGMNLAVNTATVDHTTNCTGAPCPIGGAIGTGYLGGGTYTGAVDTDYDNVDSFLFDDTQAQVVATSTGPSDLEIYTPAYIVNVSASQAAGTYSTTLTYVCTGLF